MENAARLYHRQNHPQKNAQAPDTRGLFTRLTAVFRLKVERPRGEQVLVTGDEIEAVTCQDGRYEDVQTDQGIKDGLTRLQSTTGSVQRP